MTDVSPQAERERVADLRAQEKPAGVHKIGVQSPGFIRAVHPEHGEPVVFVPGEMLPAWAAEALAAGHGRLEDGHIVLESKRKAKS